MSLTVPSSSATPPARDRLSRLVAFYAELPDDAAALAADVLELVARRYDAVGTTAALTEYDDEPLTDEDRAAIAEGQAEYDRGEYRELADVCADLGITSEALAAAERELDARDAGRPSALGAS